MIDKKFKKFYRGLSEDPNERGRLWKEHSLKHNTGLVKEINDYYEEQFIKNFKKLKKTL